MPLVPLALLGALVYVFINTLKYAQAKQWGSVLTQCSVWLAGVVAVFLVGASKIGDFIEFTIKHGTPPVEITYTLGGLDPYSKIVLGLLASSLFATGVDKYLNARDNTSTARVPQMFARFNAPLDVPTPPSDPDPVPEPASVPESKRPSPSAGPVKRARAKKQ